MKAKVEVKTTCGMCKRVTPVMKQYTLSLEGKPTLGRCPYYENGKWSVLLSQKSCEHFI